MILKSSSGKADVDKCEIILCYVSQSNVQSSSLLLPLIGRVVLLILYSYVLDGP